MEESPSGNYHMVLLEDLRITVDSVLNLVSQTQLSLVGIAQVLHLVLFVAQ